MGDPWPYPMGSMSPTRRALRAGPEEVRMRGFHVPATGTVMVTDRPGPGAGRAAGRPAERAVGP